LVTDTNLDLNRQMSPNNKVFQRAQKGVIAQTADCKNNAGGLAYTLSDEGALATLCCTGTFHNTFYVDSHKQLEDVLKLCEKVNPVFIAKSALYSRLKAYMKDMPCVLLAILLTKDTVLFKQVFPRVVDSAKMIRSFVQILRSGVVGRKSFGTVVTKCVRKWFDGWDDANRFFNSTVGNNPSIGDIVRLAHVKPKNEEFSALYAYLCGFPYNHDHLPENVKRYELLKKNYSEGIYWNDLPEINFQYLTSVKLTPQNWKSIARNASWQTTRMNLNAFARNGVFDSDVEGAYDANMVGLIMERLRDPNEIARSKVFPYSLLMAYKMTENIPQLVRDALQDAMEISTQNVPTIEGRVIVAIDSSGSMDSSVTGNRGSATSRVTCSDVAGLVAAAIKRKNHDAVIIAFDTTATVIDINHRDSTMSIAQQLSRAGGGTDISSCIRLCNERKIKGDMFIVVSDNESWFDGRGGYWRGSATGAQEEWNTFESNNPGAKYVGIDIQPNTTTQVKERNNVINVAGWSDTVFDLLAAVANGNGGGTFVKTIESIEI